MSVDTRLPDLDYVLAEDPPHEMTLHAYPRDPAYRRSGALVPQPGDIARCGHIMKGPPCPELARMPPTCVRCRVLRGLA